MEVVLKRQNFKIPNLRILFFGWRLNYVFLLLVVVFSFSSCIGLKKGFISDTRNIEAEMRTEIFNPDSTLEAIKEIKLALNDSARKLAAMLPTSKNDRIRISHLNKIFDNLQEQLNQDSTLHALARVQNSPGAVQELLNSANIYQENYSRNNRLRRVINRGDISLEVPPRMLNKSKRFLLSPAIRKSAGLSGTENNLPRASLCKLSGFSLYRRFDRINETGYEIVNFLSKIFGNTVGLIKYDRLNAPDLLALDEILEPLDIVLVKSESHLTDKFIPGYFGHSGIYTGTMQEIEDEGWINFPQVAAHRESIEKGKIFVEGLRSGVKLSTIEEYADGETYLVIRIMGLSLQEKNRYMNKIFMQVDKQYDFNFDVDSPNRIFCTELVYIVFDNIEWETYFTFGRKTISPDDLIQTGFKLPQIQFIVLITPEQVIHFPAPALLKKLLEDNK